ncbi:hypothetical protein LIZ76_17925 [Caldibacillus sp. 210928-DFI.2.22]|uniref:hypothetical protein n=1 Tax=unclassified Caldibacillus TaxID=2641266 RepID=UPI001D060C80|nr:MULTISPECIES: hypothetical protein [unclassified Caldibacillus]MCB7071774.1 hypothetical protein [Caldibacillus sp. 210928-DFI.2.22]MCB7073977.1 hypothetical protein [Caldibacillus sp. 210928-DFI.2.18]
MTTKPILVTILRRKILDFDDETYSRHHFEVKNTSFWRRNPFSSTFSSEKHPILTTRLFLVNFFKQKTPDFDDETHSRHHFEA